MTTFVSHAQNFEDVMLWRALKHVEGGFYLDVGAWSPDTDSITRAFYERGWRGINVEPSPAWHAKLNERRPDDTNMAVALSDAPGEQTLYFFDHHGIATMDAEVAREHAAQNWEAQPTRVPVTTLDAIWEAHVGTRQVHFLKVDVEGWEAQVLRGNDWRKHRPWVVVVESTRPLTQTESHQAWEPLLTEADYQLAYMDGLNRFYVAAEHAELLPALKYPPNYFDHFVLAGQRDAEAWAADAEARARANEGWAVDAEQRVKAAEGWAQDAEARFKAAEGWAQDAEQRFKGAEGWAVDAEARAKAAEGWAQDAEARARAAEAHAAEAEQRASQAEARAAAAELELENVYRSRSWRWTKPIRSLKRSLKTTQDVHA